MGQGDGAGGEPKPKAGNEGAAGLQTSGWESPGGSSPRTDLTAGPAPGGFHRSGWGIPIELPSVADAAAS